VTPSQQLVTTITSLWISSNYSLVMTNTIPLNDRCNELYGSLSREITDQLRPLEEIRTLPAGSALLTADSPVRNVIILTKGSVEISVPAGNKSISMAVAGEGKVFGLRAIVTGLPTEINVTCLDECTVTLLPRDEFLDLLRDYPQIYFAIARVLSADLKLAQDLLCQIARTHSGGYRGPRRMLSLARH